MKIGILGAACITAVITSAIIAMSPASAACTMTNDGRCIATTQRVAYDANGMKAKRVRNTTSRECLTADTRALLDDAERHFGIRFKIVSTCRPHAVIAGTRHSSWHAHHRAVDLVVPKGTSKRAVVEWFYAHARGVTMTYRRMPHVHFDTGNYHALACGGCRARGHLREASARSKVTTP